MPSVVVGPSESIRDALTAAGPGGTVTVQPGEYTYLQIEATDAGVEGLPTTIQSAVKWGARIVPPTGRHGIYLASGADYITIDGFEVSGTDPARDGIKSNANHTVVKNCYIHDCGGQGVGAFSAPYLTVQDCLIEANGSASGDHGIYCSSDFCTITGNLIRQCHSFGIHCYLAAGVDNITIQNNVSYDHGSSAIIVQGKGTPATIVVANNVAAQGASNAEAAISLRGCNGAVVANNLMIGGIGQMLDQRVNEAGSPVDCSNTVFTNNHVYTNTENDNTHGAVNTDEILSNTGFETDGTGGQPFANWTKSESGSSTVTSDATNQDTGSKCCKLHVDSGSSCAVYQSSTMVVGGVYTLEFRAKASGVVAVQLNPPIVQCSLTTAYKTFRITFVATATYLYLQRATGSGTYDIYIDNVSLKRAYGPQVRSITARLFYPRVGSRLIDAGSNTYKPATDFWGETLPTDVQIGAFPYTEHLHPRTMLNDPWNITKVNRRWWNWRRREQTLKPA